MTADSSRGEFDRERDPVQPAADAGNDWRSLVTQLEATSRLQPARSMKSFTAGNVSTSTAFKLESGGGLGSGGSQ